MSKLTDDNEEVIDLIEENVISDTGDGTGFSADWNKIEENYQKENFEKRSHRHHHHHSGEHHSSGHHSSGHHSSGHHSHHSGSSHSHSSSSSLKRSAKRMESRKYKNDHRGSHSHHSKRKERKKWSTGKKVGVGILLFLLCVIIGAVAAFIIIRWNGKNKLTNYENMNLNLPNWVDNRDGGYIIYYKGHEYTFNKNIATILFMGIDNRKLKKNATMGTAGQADALYLLTYDTNTAKMKVLTINRDTMADISRFDASGKYVDTKKTQICLAYAFGDGKKTSAENQNTAVERLIYNIPINAYYGIDLSAIKILNDDVGGVTVTSNYDFGKFKKGKTYHLKGNDAEAFVRTRNINVVDDNKRRIECQKTYINGFARALIPAIQSNYSVPIKLYNHSQKYTVTNVDAGELAYLATDLAFRFSGFDMINTKGKYKMVKGDASAEYFLKEVPFFETILSIFYTQTG